ncbi:metallophosphoesterase [Nitrospira sp. Kam-Ns4a]
MIPQHVPWPRRAWFVLTHKVENQVVRLHNVVPWLEVGLSRPAFSRLACRSAPLAGRRAIHITDLHLNVYRPRHDRILADIARAHPDWIFVTGDLLSLPRSLPHLFRFLAGLRQIAPVYLTLGNHDHLSRIPPDRFKDLADRHKLTLLINETVFVPLRTGELSVVGLDDPTLHRADVRCIPPRAPDRFTVLLAHAPAVLDLLDGSHGVDLALCGHSHGGQWRLPGIRPFWMPYGCRGRVAGLHERNGHCLYVNRGLGWSGLPIRLNCPPEILQIEWSE